MLIRGVSTLLLLTIATALAAQTQYFPKGALDSSAQSDQFVSTWYSSELTKLEEPSLFELSKIPAAQSYRFLWIRTFHRPIVVRLDVNADGTASLTAKSADGEGGYPGTIKNMIATSHLLSRQQTERFQSLVNNLAFWSLTTSPPKGDSLGADGAEWVIEAANQGKYHVVHRWSPLGSHSVSDRAISELGIALAIELAGFKIPKNEMY